MSQDEWPTVQKKPNRAESRGTKINVRSKKIYMDLRKKIWMNNHQFKKKKKKLNQTESRATKIKVWTRMNDLLTVQKKKRTKQNLEELKSTYEPVWMTYEPPVQNKTEPNRI